MEQDEKKEEFIVELTKESCNQQNQTVDFLTVGTAPCI